MASLVGVFAALIPVYAEVELLSDGQTVMIFSGGQSQLGLQLRNTASTPAEVALQYRIFQVSSSLVAPVGNVRPLDKLTLPANETVLKSATVELPAVSTETRYLVAWFNHDSKLGSTVVTALPRDLLNRLKNLGGSEPVGVVDPDGHLRPFLGALQTTELKEAEDIGSTESSLILVAPMSSKSRPAGLNRALKKKARVGAGVVLLEAQATAISSDRPAPLFVLQEGTGRIVVGPATLCANFSDSPQAQRNLLNLAEIASGRRKLELSDDPGE